MSKRKRASRMPFFFFVLGGEGRYHSFLPQRAFGAAKAWPTFRPSFFSMIVLYAIGRTQKNDRMINLGGLLVAPSPPPPSFFSMPFFSPFLSTASPPSRQHRATRCRRAPRAILLPPSLFSFFSCRPAAQRPPRFVPHTGRRSAAISRDKKARLLYPSFPLLMLLARMTR